MIRLLVDRGARLDAVDERGRTPLDVASAAREPDEEAIAVLRQLSADGTGRSRR
jgi:ankyrin repeat protein